ncbi:MAG: hypothetical protein F8N37_20180 [Telmatospirillum sp.]|nr:hypothetical protein [Telmatospirillum sp.]
MNRVLATMAVLAGVIGPVATAPASTPDDALVRKIIEKAIDPKIWDLRPEMAQAYFGDLIHFEKVGKGRIGQDPCAEGFKVKEPWPALSLSSFDFGNDTCDGKLPLHSFELDFFGEDAPLASPVLSSLHKRLGKPTADRANPDTHVGEVVWDQGDRRVVMVEYDIGDDRGFTIRIIRLPMRDGEQ